MRRRRVLGLAEMMNFPGVVAGAPSELEKLALDGARHVDGHAPGLLGPELQAYAAAGIYSDHEALTVEEGRERLRAGMWLLVREASMARNLHALLPLVEEYGPWRIAFCTDDRDPEDIADSGHMNGMVREAVAAGISPEDAVLMASHHPALWHGLSRHGAIAPGYVADLLVLPDLVELPADDGAEAGPGDRGRRRASRSPTGCGSPFALRLSRLGISRSRGAGDRRERSAWSRIRSSPSRCEREPVVEGGQAVASQEHDLAKIAVVERHLATGRVGLGFVSGSGLQRGALASSVAHDAHNLVVVGMSDRDMAYAVERLVELGGGIVAVDGLRVLAECPLPVAGLLSDAPLADVIAQSRACNEAAHGLGWTGATPFLTLAFLALSVIPHLKITDRGLVDVDRFELVPLAVSDTMSGTHEQRTHAVHVLLGRDLRRRRNGARVRMAARRGRRDRCGRWGSRARG